MRELEYYTYAKRVLESCTNYTQLLAARRYTKLAMRHINGHMYIKELQDIILDKIKELYID